MLMPVDIKIYLALTPCDMRKSIDTLSVLVAEQLHHSPTSGHLYLFYNKRKDKLKALYWERGCFTLWYRRLGKGHFKLPSAKEGCIELSEQQLDWLLNSFDFAKMQPGLYHAGSQCY